MKFYAPQGLLCSLAACAGLMAVELDAGMAPFGRARNGAMPQDLSGFYPQAHMLSLAGFAALGQQLNGATNGFAAPKSEMQVTASSL